MANLHIKNLIKKYASYTVLQFEEWKIADGAYWIKGGNGTGKTTLFKIIAGQTPFIGEVALNSIRLHKEPVNYRSLISYAEAEPQYPTFITGNELLDYHLKVRRTDRTITDHLIEQFKMGSFMNNKIGHYSSGMLKKLSLICAFTGNMELYILDEPLITIDTESAKVLYQYIENRRKEGCTLLISSHQEIDSKEILLQGIFQIQNQQIVPC